MDEDTAPGLRRGLAGLGLAVVVGIGAWLAWPSPPAALPAPPIPPPPPAAVAEPVAEPVAPVEPVAPPAEPTPAIVVPPVVVAPVEPQYQYIVLADGRGFIGTLDRDAGLILVQASVRGGSLARMQPIQVRIEADTVLSVTDYDGRWGPLGDGISRPPVDPVRTAAIAQAREAAAQRAEQRRKEAAEQERLRQLAQTRVAAQQRVDTARAGVATSTQREQQIAAHARILEEDRRLKLELLNGLVLQLNTAQDRWNQEQLTRVVQPDGSVTGGPTPATEALRNNLQLQIRQARQSANAAEQTLRDESAERQRLIDRLPALTTELQAAEAALAAL